MKQGSFNKLPHTKIHPFLNFFNALFSLSRYWSDTNTDNWRSKATKCWV